ncbi:3-phosphoshikimate 1-carboxyvinyltransferase [Marininema mesophilum]|uniref:3-phosphoshikimate 1-carboxyvinyltransferase n=1 Tax=Marininema mesophilum TaxID=1048340 RepID=A0A1H2UTZ1_9BACL|nr:3-phosphoshikimate 1-carboxyvinyltransferase [Marininema mesophilum]SDW59398.1 3-phosphoshikimate 1-carboxyvinyltransferase [Marininema mesophilum]
MKQLTMKPSNPLRGTIKVPGDKSISHRSVMFGSIANGTTRVEGFLPGADCQATIACFKSMGVSIEQHSPTSLTIEGVGWEGLKEPEELLDVGNSGTTIRLMLGILAGRPFYSAVAGDESIARRPMDRVLDPLREMGAKVDGRQGGRFTPLGVRGGGLKGIHYQSPVASAQIKSCILLAGLQATGETIVEEPHLSRDHTERMLRAFGVEVNSFSGGVSLHGGQQLIGKDVRVPGDISSAAFPLVAALLVPGSHITIQDVGLNPARTGILDVLHAMGAMVEVKETGEWSGEPVGDITVSASDLQGTEISGELIPRLIDEIPIIAVAATQAKGKTIIRDAAELKVKETNRIAVTATELSKLGANIEETPDGLIIEGGTPLHSGICDSRGDHRIGMATAIAGMVAKGGATVENATAINVSFPGFAELMAELSEK